MKRSTNPFRVLSIEPADLRGLTDEQGMVLAHGFYRALMRIHHQDAGGTDTEKAVRLTTAMKTLEDPANFRFWRANLVSKSRQRNELAEAEAQTASAAANTAIIESNFLAFLENAVWPDPKRISVFGIKPMRFLVSDIMRIAVQLRDNMREPRFERFSSYFELTVDKNGILRWFQVRQVPFDRRKKKPPAKLPIGWVHLSDSPGASSYYVDRTGESRIIQDARVIGTINKDEIAFKHGDLRRFIALLPPKRAQVRPEEGFKLDLFRQYLPYFEPYIERGRVLVGIRKTEGGPRFIIFGNITAIF